MRTLLLYSSRLKFTLYIIQDILAHMTNIEMETKLDHNLGFVLFKHILNDSKKIIF